MSKTTYEQYKKHSDELMELMENIENSKAPAYTGDDGDVHANFKLAAEWLGISPMQAIGLYLVKHISSIMSYAKDPSIEQGEKMQGRFADAMNYLKLMHSMYKKQEENEQNT